ncbi:MAG: putative nucleotidyltransferase substrate binding domain-containing protein [Acidimicrobiales bacterium]
MSTAPEIVEFLLGHPPFTALPPAEVERAAASAEVEFHLAGTIIFSQGAHSSEFLRVIRAGVVEIVHDGRVLDVIGVGEMFGHASMLSGLPTGFAARAAEDALTYRIPADAAYRLLGQPATLRYVTRSLLQDRYGIRHGRSAEVDRDRLSQPVANLLRSPAVICPPDTPIREAAREMSSRGATAVVIDLGSSLGILTDRDLRSRVLAVGLSPDTPVSAAMTAPAETVPGDRLASEVLLDMLDRSFRHFPVLSPTGSLLGVVADSDLVEVQTHSSFSLRREIARAADAGELAAVAAQLPPTIVSLHRANMAPLAIEAVFSIVSDALTRRALEFAAAEVGEPPVAFAWLALGSQARREAVPSSDLDSAVAFLKSGDPALDVDGVIRPYFSDLALRATEILVACGFHPDTHRTSASDPLFVRSLDSWQSAVRSWLDDPAQDKALVLMSILVDSRPVFGAEVADMLARTLLPARAHPNLLRMLARFSLSHRPPTGFLSGLVVEHSGEHRGRLDLKEGGALPIVSLARWAGLAAGVLCASTPERLRAASDAGILAPQDAETLIESFELVSELRLEHQVAQLTAGTPPDDFVDPAQLSPLTRSYLKEAFRAVAAVQQTISNDLSLL